MRGDDIRGFLSRGIVIGVNRFDGTFLAYLSQVDGNIESERCVVMRVEDGPGRASVKVVVHDPGNGPKPSATNKSSCSRQLGLFRRIS